MSRHGHALLRSGVRSRDAHQPRRGFARGDAGVVHLAEVVLESAQRFDEICRRALVEDVAERLERARLLCGNSQLVPRRGLVRATRALCCFHHPVARALRAATGAVSDSLARLLARLPMSARAGAVEEIVHEPLICLLSRKRISSSNAASRRARQLVAMDEILAPFDGLEQDVEIAHGADGPAT